MFVSVAVGVVPPGYFNDPDGEANDRLVGVEAYTTCTVSDFPAPGAGSVIALAPTIVVMTWNVPLVNASVIALPVTVAEYCVSV